MKQKRYERNYKERIAGFVDQFIKRHENKGRVDHDTKVSSLFNLGSCDHFPRFHPSLYVEDRNLHFHSWFCPPKLVFNLLPAGHSNWMPCYLLELKISISKLIMLSIHSILITYFCQQNISSFLLSMRSLMLLLFICMSIITPLPISWKIFFWN